MSEATTIATIATWPRPAVLPPPGERLVVVEASAGTGKTYFLEHRVVDLILAGARLDQILLVTFTDKATAELRGRIRDLVDRMARAVPTEPSTTASTTAAAADPTTWRLDAATRGRLRDAVTAFDHAPIFTIHGFCQRVLVEDAFAARRLFDQTQVADEVAFDDAFFTLLRARFARDPDTRPLLRAYLEADHTVEHLRGLLLQCARADALPYRRFDPAAVVALATRLQGALAPADRRDAFTASLTLKGGNKNHVPRWLVQIGDALAGLDLTAPPPQLLGALDALRHPAASVAGKRDVLAIPPAFAAVGDDLAAVATLISLDEAIAAAFLPEVLTQVGHAKAERGLFDYQDMLTLVAAALTGPRGAELAARLRARLPHAMIDEFQDTDPTQWAIFRTVWLHPDAAGLTIVGDPKQAIYSFRGADVRTYLAARDELLGRGAHRVVLDVNRRSTAALVAATNALLDGDGVTGLLDGAITYDTPVRASGAITADDAGRPPLTVFTISPGGADAVRTALSDAIGGELEALRAAAPGWRKGDTARPFALRDVLVLTRSNRESDDVAHDLRARGLPCALVERDRLFDTREADELAHVLAAIAAPRDRSARLRALRTRFFAVPWDALQDVVDAPDHHPLLARLFEWSSLALHRNYETLFRRLVEDSRLAERALLLGGGERVVTNTWHVLELLLEEVARSRGDLHELAALLRRWIDDELHRQDDLDVQRAETDGDAVRVMTVHKAKGLEAPYVFLYGMISTPPPNDVRTIHDHAGRVLLVGKQPDPLDQQSKREAQEENQRLMYVAVTRAQLRLYLPRYPEGVLKGDGPPYVPLQRCLVTITGERAAHLRHHLDLVAVAGDAAPPAAPPSLAGLALPPPPEVAPLPPLPTAQRGLVVVSYTRLAHDLAGAALPTNLAAVDPAEFDVDDSVGEVADDELPPGAAAGLMLHDVLERVDPAVAAATADPVAWAAAPAVAAILADAARARGISPRHLPHAARLCHATLTAPLVLDDGAPLPALAAPGTRLAREVEFAFPLPGRDPDAAARGLVRGFIDVLVGYDDALWVLDYKSDLLPGATAAELTAAARHRTDARYAIQARLYALAAARLAGPRPLAGLLYHYVRHGVVVAIRTDDATLTRWAAWLADLELAP